jgi:acetylornithine deacetylase/succinyl-diaminopimelate desuccinylase-like protein
MGITTGGGAHTVNEYIDIEPIERGLASCGAICSVLSSGRLVG